VDKQLKNVGRGFGLSTKSTTPTFRYLSWWRIEHLVHKLAEKVGKEEPTLILGMSRGGAIPTTLLIKELGYQGPHNLVLVSYYKGVAKTKKEPFVHIPRHISLRGEKVLLVDDVADTGHSLHHTVRAIKEKGVGSVTTATLHYKPWSIIQPDAYCEKTEDWIIYPWEVQETIADLSSDTELSEDLRDALVKGGLPPSLLELCLSRLKTLGTTRKVGGSTETG